MKKAHPSKLLIVDDQEPMRLLLAQFVEQDLGAEVALAGTCEAALHLAAENAYDVILLDLLMPGVGGVEVLRRIRAGSKNRATPIVVVSILGGSLGRDEHISVAHAKSLGANAVVSKPVNRSTLITEIKAQLRAELAA